MKAKSNITKAQRPEPIKPPAEVKKQRKPKPTFPEYPLGVSDLPLEMPEITQSELDGYLNALYHHKLALADYERRRANLFYKLALGSKVDPKSEIKARLDNSGRIVLNKECGTCPSNYDPRSEVFW